MKSMETSLPVLLLVGSGLDGKMMGFDSIVDSQVPCQIVVKQNGKEAMKYLVDQYQELPAMLVLDHNFPEPDGKELISWLRFYDETRSLPVVLLTAGDEA